MFIDSPMSCNDATFTVEIPPGSSHPPSAVGPLGIVHDPRRMHYRQLVPWRPVIRFANCAREAANLATAHPAGSVR